MGIVVTILFKQKVIKKTEKRNIKNSLNISEEMITGDSLGKVKTNDLDVVKNVLLF